jgi:hypothetical protein
MRERASFQDHLRAGALFCLLMGATMYCEREKAEQLTVFFQMIPGIFKAKKWTANARERRMGSQGPNFL